MLILPRWFDGIWGPMELMKIAEPVVERFAKLLCLGRGRRPIRVQVFLYCCGGGGW